jgi:nitric oxide dioxygenase
MSSISSPQTTTLDADLIRSTYLIILTQSDEFATSFYEILFEKYPNTRNLFLATDLEKQKKKLMESLDLVLVNVHSPKAFSSILKDLGKRHVKYGAVLTDYPLVGDALLQALERHLGTAWNQNVQHAWTLAYQIIANLMAEGAKEDFGKVLKSEKPPHTTSESNIPIEQKSTFILNKILPIVYVGIVVICGYAVWSLTQPQSPQDNTPTSRTDR